MLRLAQSCEARAGSQLQQEGSIHGQAGQGGGAEQRFLEDREPCSKVSSAAAGTSVALHREKVSLSSPSVSMP